MIRTLLFLTLILEACSTGISSPQPVPPSPSASVTLVPTIVVPAVTFTVETPQIDPNEAVTTVPPETQNCGYQWAYGDLPELSRSFQQSIQALQPEANARAYAFGENCLLPDGTIGRFLTMETDFEVTLRVRDTADESVLGEWIVKVMRVIEAVPPEQIAGPRPGLVRITFQSGIDQKHVGFYINQYQDLPDGLSHSEIYQALQTPQ